MGPLAQSNGHDAPRLIDELVPCRTTMVDEIVDKLNTEINAGLADPRLKAQLADLGGIILGGSPDDFRTLVAEETEKWGKVIRAANIKPE